jgi:hypothetical protein
VELFTGEAVHGLETRLTVCLARVPLFTTREMQRDGLFLQQLPLHSGTVLATMICGSPRSIGFFESGLVLLKGVEVLRQMLSSLTKTRQARGDLGRNAKVSNV